MVRNISVIGLGKIGLPLCHTFAKHGFKVIGVDHKEVVDRISNHETHIQTYEQQLFNNVKSNLQFKNTYHEAILNSEVTFVIVPTPTDESGLFSNHHVIEAITKIGRSLKSKESHHIVTIVSTVIPGSMQGEIKAALETFSERHIGDNLDLCYSPVFIAIGSVYKDLENPDMVLIGESNQKAGDVLAAIFRKVCHENTPIIRMNLVNAEITKIAVSTFVTTKISYANMLSDLCEKIPMADINVVTDAMGLDTRIGKKYLKAGAPYGGPCFPRDNLALSTIAKNLNARYDIITATEAINNYQYEKILSLLCNQNKSKKITIVGLAFKNNTDVIEASTGIRLSNDLARSNFCVSVYEATEIKNIKHFLHTSVTIKDSLEACLNDSDIIVLTTDNGELEQHLKPEYLSKRNERLLVVDIWGALTSIANHDMVDLYQVGSHNSELKFLYR